MYRLSVVPPRNVGKKMWVWPTMDKEAFHVRQCARASVYHGIETTPAIHRKSTWFSGRTSGDMPGSHHHLAEPLAPNDERKPRWIVAWQISAKAEGDSRCCSWWHTQLCNAWWRIHAGFAAGSILDTQESKIYRRWRFSTQLQNVSRCSTCTCSCKKKENQG